MPSEIRAIAVLEAHEGMEDELETLLREFYSMLQRKGYTRDTLYRDTENPRIFVNFRYWLSEETRREAHEDPDVHRYWYRLGHICSMKHISKGLEELARTAHATVFDRSGE
jgi:quinol monooxygenase YgiN